MSLVDSWFNQERWRSRGVRSQDDANQMRSVERSSQMCRYIEDLERLATIKNGERLVFEMALLLCEQSASPNLRLHPGPQVTDSMAAKDFQCALSFLLDRLSHSTATTNYRRLDKALLKTMFALDRSSFVPDAWHLALRLRKSRRLRHANYMDEYCTRSLHFLRDVATQETTRLVVSKVLQPRLPSEIAAMVSDQRLIQSGVALNFRQRFPPWSQDYLCVARPRCSPSPSCLVSHMEGRAYGHRTCWIDNRTEWLAREYRWATIHVRSCDSKIALCMSKYTCGDEDDHEFMEEDWLDKETHRCKEF